MLKSDFDRVIGLFAECAAGKSVSVEAVFREALDFFEKVNEVLKEGSPPDKKQALEMMGEMYRRMTEASQAMSKSTGLSEEQLSKVADNPANFSPEQWRAMQSAKERMVALSKDLINALDTLNPQGKGLDHHPPKNPNTPLKHKKKDKSDWLKS